MQAVAGRRRHCFNVLIVVLVICSAVLLNVLYALAKNFVALHREFWTSYTNYSRIHTHVAVWPSGYFPHNTYGFHPLNEHGVYSFWNVCIEALNTPVTRVTDYYGKKIFVNETAKVIVYNSFYRDGLQRLHVFGSANSDSNNWDVHFRRGHIPSSHTFHNSTAFFVAQTCPANLHHFWIDEFVPLFSVVNRVNRLHPDADNQVLYRLPTDQAGTDISGCYNKTAFEDILKTLFINPFHDVFFRAPVNECYSSAVFGTHAVVSDPRTIISHVTRSILGKETVYKIASSKFYVTFVQRKYRRIINIRELLQTALNIGFRQVRIVYFERHSVKEQMQLAASSCIMIGIQGAGLQWSVFMPHGCTLIEIAWPSRHWGFHFHNYVNPYGITYYSLRANARVNWAAYEKNVRNGKKVSSKERLKLLKEVPRTPSVDNVWKWADAFVNKDYLQSILTAIDPYPRLQRSSPFKSSNLSMSQ